MKANLIDMFVLLRWLKKSKPRNLETNCVAWVWLSLLLLLLKREEDKNVLR
jgi:hypothetical protein